jgi:tetratricopeptide (TPR) repeat protein
MFDSLSRRASSCLAAVVFALLCAGTLPSPARAAVMKSQIPGAHYTANAAARVELNRAQSRTTTRNLAGAEAAARAAVAADSLSGEAWQTLGMIRLARSDYDGARTALESAASLAPERADVWTRLAQICLINLGFVEEGTTALQAAVEADSTYGPAWYSQGFFLWTRGDLVAADAAIQRARDNATTQSQDALWYSAQLGIITAGGRYAEAVTAIKNYRFSVTDDITALQHEAHALRGKGDARAALTSLNALRGALPKEPLWMIETGHAYVDLGEPDSARAWFSRAATADPKSFDAGYNKALALAATKDTAGAWTELRRLRDIDPTNWLVPLYASRLHRAKEDTARATLAFDEARRLNPALGLAGASAAGTAAVPAWSSPELEDAERLIERGDFTLALDRLYAASQDSLRRGAALYWMARLTRMSSSQAGPPVVAAHYGVRASNGDPVVLRALAEMQAAAGDTARAVTNLLTLRKMAPDDDVATALLAAILLHGGEPARAKDLFAQEAKEPTRSYRIESVRAAALTAVNDPGAAIAKSRAAGLDYLPPPRPRRGR